MINKPIQLLAFFSLFFLIISCGENETKKSNKNILKTYPVEQSEKNDSLVSALGMKIQNSIYNGDAESYVESYDLHRHADLITQIGNDKINISRYKKGFIDGYVSSFKNLPKKLTESVENGAFYDFISYYYDDYSQSYRMLFRFFAEEEGLNYHDYSLIYKDDKFAIEDLYVYISGESLSETTNTLFLSSLPKNIFQKIMNFEEVEDFSNFVNAISAKKNGDPYATLRHLNKIKGDLTKKKVYFLFKAMAALDSENKAVYEETVDKIVETFPGEASTDFFLIDYHFIKEEYAKAIEAIARIEEYTNDDFLSYLKANVALEAKDYIASLALYKETIKNYPEYFNAELGILVSNANLKKYNDCISQMNAIITKELMTKEDLIVYVEEVNLDGYNMLGPLAESKLYNNWKKQ